MSKKILLILSSLVLLCVAIPNDLLSQVYYNWEKNEDSRSIALVNDKLYMAGSSESCLGTSLDFSIIVTDTLGNLLDRHCVGTEENDQCLSIIKLLDGNLLMLGQTNNTLKNMNGLAIKVDVEGNEIARINYGAPNRNESFKSAIQLDNGNIAITGFVTSAQNTNDVLLLILNQNLEIIVENQFGDSGNDVGQDIALDNDNNIYIVGDTYNQATNSYDVILVKTNTNGVFIWQKIFGNELNNGSQGLLHTSDDNLLLYGETEIFTFSPFDFWVHKVSLNGDSIWYKSFGGAGTDALFSATEIKNNFFFTGYSNSNTINQPLDATLVWCNSNGEVLDQYYYGREGVDIGYKIIHDDFNIFITGKSPNTADEDAFLVKVPVPINLSAQKRDQLNDVFLKQNQSTDFLYLNEIQEPSEFEIYSTSGALVYMCKLGNNNGTKIDISFLKNGLYICKLKSSKKILTDKIIKQ